MIISFLFGSVSDGASRAEPHFLLLTPPLSLFHSFGSILYRYWDKKAATFFSLLNRELTETVQVRRKGSGSSFCAGKTPRRHWRNVRDIWYVLLCRFGKS